MVSESRVTWATSVPILVLGLSVLDLGPVYTRQTDRRQTRIIAYCLRPMGAGHNNAALPWGADGLLNY